MFTNQLIFIRSAIIALAASSLVFVTGPLAYAQTIGQPAPAFSPNSSSSATSFQDAGYQQSSASAATTATGVADTLKQPANGSKIIVTGGLPNQTPEPTKSNKTPIAIFITIAAITGLVLIVIYLKKTTKKQASQEQEFVQELALQSKLTKKSELASTAQTKPKKAKKKNKKHHR